MDGTLGGIRLVFSIDTVNTTATRVISGFTPPSWKMVTRCALKLSALTFVRPGELHHAEWTEIDLNKREWRIPAHKMKMRAIHIVPLSRFRSITGIAAAEGLDVGQASRIARPTQLAPEIVESCLTGGKNRPVLENLNRRALPVEWEEQRLLFLAPFD